MSAPILQHPRVVAAAAAATPAFAVAADGGSLLWANAAAAAFLGERTQALPHDLHDDPLGPQLRGVAGLAAGAAPRLVHLRLPRESRRLVLTGRAEHFAGADGDFVLVVILDAPIPATIPEAAAGDEGAAQAPEPLDAAAGLPPVREVESSFAEPSSGELPQAVSGESGEPDPPPGPARLPLRVLWQSDADGRITLVSPDLGAAFATTAAPIAGRHWNDFSTTEADAAHRLDRALAGRDTWSGLAVQVPLDDGRVASLELSALPMFDRDRAFRGFRGFGVVRRPPAAGAAAIHRPPLDPSERSTLREIALALNGGPAAPTTADAAEPDRAADVLAPPPPMAVATRPAADGDARAALEALPAAILIHRRGVPLFANRAFLDLAGASDLAALVERGLEGLVEAAPEHRGGLRLTAADGRTIPVEGILKSIAWDGAAASLLTVRPLAEATPQPPEAAVHAADERFDALAQEARELRAILDTAADGVVLLDGDGRILAMNRSAEALFGYERAELEGRSFTLLFAGESQPAATGYLAGLRANGVATVLNDGREVLGVVRRGGVIPLFMTLGRIGEATEPRFCAVLRDLTPFKRAEEELRTAKAEAERASGHKSDFLARISHEIRTPLNAILGFTELMMEERFGPVGNPRYRGYLNDIHTSGRFVVSLVDDLLDLSKIEAGKLDLEFAGVGLNEVVAGAVALLQPQANRGRIIIRTSLAPKLPPVMADLRSLKQIVLNLLTNAVKFTPAGGQVIVSTALTDLGQAVVRMRDSGVGMSEREIKTALEPFGQVSPTAGGTGLGLPLTKALVEANRASFAIHSTAGAGTLVEVIFPPTRVLVD